MDHYDFGTFYYSNSSSYPSLISEKDEVFIAMIYFLYDVKISQFCKKQFKANDV